MQITSLLVLKSWHKYAHSHPDRGLKCMQDLLKNGHILIKNILLMINFQDEGHLDANFLIYILTIYSECLHFQFLARGIRGILTGVQNGRMTRRKNTDILLRNVLFEAYF